MKSKLATFATFIAAIVTLAFLLRRHVPWQSLADQEQWLRELVARRPLACFAAGYLAYVVVSLIPGTTGKSLIAGWLFGLWQGALMVNLGLTTAAVLAFLISRNLIRDAVQSRYGFELSRVNEALRREGAFYLFALRMVHAPYAMTNYAMGASSIGAVPFWWATQLGMLPGNIVFVYAGTRLPNLEAAAQQGIGAIFTPQLIAAFALAAVFPLAVRRAVLRIWKRDAVASKGGA